MDLATGAMGSLLPKLAKLLNDEYKLQTRVKEDVKSLEKEMKSMYAALRKVAEVPRDQLDEQVKLWAGEVRELSFDMEDVVDKFLVRVDDGYEPATKSDKLKRLTKKMAGLFTRGKARHEIADAIEVINKQVKEIADRRERYNIDNIAGRPAAVTLDPLLRALYTEVTELVGIDGKRDQELMKLVSNQDNVSEKKLKIVSVVGFGGLGKTTLVKTVYDKIKRDFNCCAFVSVGRNADPKKILMDILLDLGMEGSQLSMLDETRLINKLRESLEKKRYLIVIDDIWDEKLWTTINWAFSNSNNFGSRLITTTRIVSVSKLCCSSINDSVYQMEPLSDDDSKRLFSKRIFGQETGCPLEFEEVSRDILKKCGGVPLAIITIASVLASEKKVNSLDEWHVLLESIGRGLTEDPSVEEMIKLTKLLCLRINGGRFQLPDGVGNLRSMEVLPKIKVGSVSIVQELGNMDRLRELNIQFESSEPMEAFVESLGKMPKIQRVKISAKCEGEVSMDLLGEGWKPPTVLREFIMYKGVSFSTLPAWNPSHLSQLSVLEIHVVELRQEDLGLLGRLPALRDLWLVSDSQRPLLIGAEGFRCLERVSLYSNSPSHTLFQPGALPKAERVCLEISLRAEKEEAAGNGGDWFDLGIENFPSLRHVDVELSRLGVTVRETKQAKAALKKALRAHPNRPNFNIYFDKRIPEDDSDEESDEESE